ncbi:hypothetical protein EV207_1385 [Scopulibacillus darangshiensis]|uniref:Uncharacterized protein n=1 Tax=Scopulibacillus darangshiensis TaxID=442528 RepID=A0A4R2NKA8_9BACL|nr:hypothetical protein [Scopulibacillus darangshiensis]TCP21920.1 hypothetical protein EV207_1385 [Scopulibacillus darangshiensis]
MNFPMIHTNFWDAVLAIPIVMILTQITKIIPIPSPFIPAVAVFYGLLVSVFFSHPHNLLGGIFMGYFYGYAAIGNYSALKTSFLAFRKKQDKKAKYD